MKRIVFPLLIYLLIMTGCSLAEDVTPPPASATQQAVAQLPLATQQRPAPVTKEAEVEEAAAPETPSDQGTGSVYGSIENGTEGAELPRDLEVTFFAFDGNQLAFEDEVQVDADGSFIIQDLEIVPGRIFGVFTEYQGVRYFNTAGHMLEDNHSLELPLKVYETTTDDELIVVERLHMILETSLEGVVEVSELMFLTNTGDQTINGQDGLNEIRITLPKNFTNLRFPDSAALMRFTETADGFVIQEPFVPGETVEIFFNFTLPYQRSLEYRQPADYPFEAIVILKAEGPPSISGDGLSALGARDMGGIFMESYRMDPLERDEILELRLSGRHPARVDSSSTTNLIIGAAVLCLALIVLFYGWWRWSRRYESADEYDVETAPEEPSDKEALIRAIAALDEMNEAGEVTGTAYTKRREALKHTLRGLIESEHD